jgi:hypothetical protein
MSQPIVPKPVNPGVPRSILRRLSAVDVSHDFDVISDAPPPRRIVQETAQQSQAPAQAAPTSKAAE